MDNNMNYAIEDFRRRNRYGLEDIPDYLPSQDEDVFSFNHLQLHQHKKKISNRQKQQIMQRPSMYEKIVGELSQNPNSDHLQLVGSSKDLDKNVEIENRSLSSSSMSVNNGLVKRHLSDPGERFSTYDRIVHELSTERSRFSDRSMSVIGGYNADNIITNENVTGVILDDYGQLPTKDFTDVSQESRVVPHLVKPNFTTLDMLSEETNPIDTVRTESSGIHLYPSKDMKNYVNNKNKLQAEGVYDDHSLNQENRKLTQICDQNVLDRVSSMSIHPTALSKDDNIVNNQLSSLSRDILDPNIRLNESSNQHISGGSSWSDQGNQNDLNNYNLSSADEPQNSKYISESHSTFNSLELSNKQFNEHNTNERRNTSLLEYFYPPINASRPESTASQDFFEYEKTKSLAESSRREWGVTGAIKGLITGVLGHKVTQTSPERAQQVKEIADLNIIFRY